MCCDNVLILVYRDIVSDICYLRTKISVFPDIICDFPLECEIEFAIDLVPGTRLVPMDPCRVSASELGDKNIQLEEMLEKKFFRPSVLP